MTKFKLVSIFDKGEVAVILKFWLEVPDVKYKAEFSKTSLGLSMMNILRFWNDKNIGPLFIANIAIVPTLAIFSNPDENVG